MKRILKNIVSVLLLLCLAFSIVGCFWSINEEDSMRRLIVANSKVEVPSNSEMVYRLVEGETGFREEQFQYAVFQLESNPTDWLNKNSFTKKGMDDEFERCFSSALKTKPDDIEEIPQEFLPDFNEVYYYLRTENIYFAYSPQSFLLFVINPKN